MATLENYLENEEDQIEKIMMAGLTLKDEVVNKTFAVAHANTYFDNLMGFYPAEIAVGSFSVSGGVNASESFLLYPKVAVGAATHSVYENIKKLALPIPPICEKEGEMEVINPFRYRNAMDAFRNHGRKWLGGITPEVMVIFTREDDKAHVVKTLHWIQERDERPSTQFIVYPLSKLMALLSIVGHSRFEKRVMIADVVAQDLLKDSALSTCTDLACEWHRQLVYLKNGMVSKCSQNIVNRSLYLAVMSLAQCFDVTLEMDKHMLDLEKTTVQIEAPGAQSVRGRYTMAQLVQYGLIGQP